MDGNHQSFLITRVQQLRHRGQKPFLKIQAIRVHSNFGLDWVITFNITLSRFDITWIPASNSHSKTEGTGIHKIMIDITEVVQLPKWSRNDYIPSFHFFCKIFLLPRRTNASAVHLAADIKQTVIEAYLRHDIFNSHLLKHPHQFHRTYSTLSKFLIPW